MIKVREQLFPESRGYEVHEFETLAEAEEFCAKNPDAEIVQDIAALAARQELINTELLDALKTAKTIIGHPDDDFSKYMSELIERAEAQKGE